MSAPADHLPPNEQGKSVNSFIAALGKLGLTGQEIADVIWLSLEIQQYPLIPNSYQLAGTNLSDSVTETSEKVSEQAPSNLKDNNQQEDTNQVGIYTLDSESSLEKGDMKFKVSDARSLREPLTLARALRPLLRRVPSGAKMVLDEVATIERIAEENIWIPLLKPNVEPWLDLALVVDESTSMFLWETTIIELQRLLRNYGIFRDIRTWGLRISPTGKVKIRPGIGKAARNQQLRSPAELIDPNGRRLILLATDCVTSYWYEGTLLPDLRNWAQNGPVAIVQMLPEWLWSRTALRLAAPIWLNSFAPGTPNQQLQTKALSVWDEVNLDDGIKVPVVTLEPNMLISWTQLVTGKGGVWSPGFVFEPEMFEHRPDAVNGESQLSAEQRVNRFHLMASPMAWELARLVAAAPVITLPVVRIIQDRLLQESRQVHVAEVFLGGLLKPTAALSEITPNTNPNDIQYKFIEDKVRQLLLEASPRSKSINVLDIVSKFVASRIGKSLYEFIAILSNPEQKQIQDREQVVPFAIVTAQILKQLGGEYARFAEQLKQSFPPSSQTRTFKKFEDNKFENNKFENNKFEDDIYISYAHIDNHPLTEGQEGWISDFHRTLQMRLAQLRGKTPKIWRDLKLQGNDYFGDTIVERFPKVALLVCILSPRYVKSDRCVKELKEFYKAAATTGGVRVADKSRIFKVIKTPVPRNEHPQEVQELLGYEFYQFDQSGRPIEFSKIFGAEAERNYWTKINDLAYDIKQMLDNLSSHDNGAVEQTPIAATGTTIYLAETTFDLIEERDKIRRELQQRGYIVLPEQSLPFYYPDFEQAVRENLERCKLSIHLIGARYGIVPEGAERSLVALQNELAAQHAQNSPEFLRLVWIPVGLQPQEPRQEELIQFLQSDPNLLQTSLEEFKTIIQDKLNPTPQPTKEALAEDGPLRVYLICDQRDREAIAPLDDYLYNQGFEVILPLFEGDEAQVRQDHQEQLQVCDVVIIYCGDIQEPWLRTKLGDLRKVYGYGRSKPMLAKAIYMGEPHTQQKRRWCRTREAQLIQNINELELFVAQLIEGGQR